MLSCKWRARLRNLRRPRRNMRGKKNWWGRGEGRKEFCEILPWRKDHEKSKSGLSFSQTSQVYLRLNFNLCFFLLFPSHWSREQWCKTYNCEQVNQQGDKKQWENRSIQKYNIFPYICPFPVKPVTSLLEVCVNVTVITAPLKGWFVMASKILN